MKSSNLGILSSIVASLCCVGPLVAVSLGLGGVGLAAFFGKSHWLWIAAAAALLTLGWIRHRKESQKACTTGCDLAGGQRTRNVLIAATVVLATFVGLHVRTWVVRSTASYSSDVPAGEVAVIPVEGMVCYTCEMALTSGVRKLDGVLSVDASAAEKRVTVRFDPGRTTRAAIVEQINASGYRAASQDRQ